MTRATLKRYASQYPTLAVDILTKPVKVGGWVRVRVRVRVRWGAATHAGIALSYAPLCPYRHHISPYVPHDD